MENGSVVNVKIPAFEKQLAWKWNKRSRYLQCMRQEQKQELAALRMPVLGAKAPRIQFGSGENDNAAREQFRWTTRACKQFGISVSESVWNRYGGTKGPLLCPGSHVSENARVIISQQMIFISGSDRASRILIFPTHPKAAEILAKIRQDCAKFGHQYPFILSIEMAEQNAELLLTPRPPRGLGAGGGPASTGR